MQIPSFLLFSIFSFGFLFTIIQGFEPSPAPISGVDSGPPKAEFSSPAPGSNDNAGYQASKFSPWPALAESPVPVAVEKGGEIDGTPTSVGEENSDIPPMEEEKEEVEVVRWCTVREENGNCRFLMSALKETNGYMWKCVNKDSTQQCLESIKKGEADLINLEAGMAYTAFINYSMKAIANEVYCDQAESYIPVAIVNRKACEGKENINLMDFKGRQSCHGGYSTATGWNYPISRIKRLFASSQEMNDRKIALEFFSKLCAPSEFEGDGICSGCGNENGTCHLDSSSHYYGHPGAFRCLVEELGDIAFVDADTALLYSAEGPYNQSWSTKSLRDFMYLCPDGGCREINGYPGSCSFGSVPANVIMASNSMPNDKRSLILLTLTNATWRDALHAGKGDTSQLLSPSTQQLAVVKKLTRSYLGKSALVSESIQKMNTPEVQTIPDTPNSDLSSSSCLRYPAVISFFSLVTMLMSMVFSVK